MNVEKQVLPIMLIIVLLVALISTYAWFSAEGATKAVAVIDSGVPTSLVLTKGGVAIGNSFTETDLDIEPYQGQKGFDAGGNAYTSEDADYAYSVTANLEYVMQAGVDVRLFVNLEKVVIELGQNYTYGLDDTIENVFGVSTAAFTQDDYLNYYSSDLNAEPSGSLSKNFYCIYFDSKVTHIVLKNTETIKNFEFDYWKSDNVSNSGKGIKKGDVNYASGVGSGIPLTFSQDCSVAGIINYLAIYIGFYGYDEDSETYSKTFSFSSTAFQGSTFSFYFLARAD